MSLKIKYYMDSNFWIYLNILPKTKNRSKLENLLESSIPEGIATNMLTLNETMFISKKKYQISYFETLTFWENVVVPTSFILNTGHELLPNLKVLASEYDIKPSDMMHIATMIQYGIDHIISEDEDFDSVENIKRIWIK